MSMLQRIQTSGSRATLTVAILATILIAIAGTGPISATPATAGGAPAARGGVATRPAARGETPATRTTTNTSPVGDQAAEPGVCKKCKPPLLPHNGPVMGTATSPGVITVTPIYWTPAGFDFSSDPKYIPVVNQYITDLAASAPFTNAVSVISEYTNTANVQLTYGITAGAPITDTTAYPATDSACPITGTFTACVTDAQLQTEVQSVLAANSLPADLSHIYPVFFPPNVRTQASDGTFGCADYVGYHSTFQLPNGGGSVIYANEPYGSCNYNGQQPNGDRAADGEVDVLGHEISEAITDPGPASNWIDAAGNEIGDECGSDYGPPIGFVNNADDTSGYNQVINGHMYYTQGEFSNAAYAAYGIGKGCLKTAYARQAAAAASAVQAHAAHAANASGPSVVTLDASPAKLPADGVSTTTITVTALDANGEPVAGDRMLVRVRGDPATPGVCGAVSSADGSGAEVLSDVQDVTNANGQVVVTYTASTANADCYVQATDTEQGTTNQALLYQGADAGTAPVVSQTLPTTLIVGGPAVTFTASASNPSGDEIANARFDLYVTGDSAGTTGLDASQLTLSYMDDATGEQFVNVPLTGSTANNGEIDGFVIPDTAQSLPPGATRTATFKLSLAAGAATTAATGAPLRIETDLDQFNPADGAQTNLDDAGPGAVPVLASSAPSATTTSTAVATAAGANTTTATTTSTNTNTNTATSTAMPTNTNIATSTAVPPMNTATAVPPTGTSAPVPPTGTSTSSAPSASATTRPNASATTAPTGTAIHPTVARRFCIAGGVESASMHSALAVLNPTARTAHIAVTFYFADSSVRAASFTVPANARRSVSVAGLARRRGNVGLCVASDRTVTGQLNLTRSGKDGDSVVGNGDLGRHWYLAEGYTSGFFHETVALLNPSASHAATVRLRLLLPGGKGNRTVTERVGAHSERLVDINSLVRNTAVSIVADADQAVLVERTLTFSSGGYGLTTREAAPNAEISWQFVEGSTAAPFQTFLTILNPQGGTANVTVSVFGAKGRRLGRRTLRLAPHSSATLRVNDIVPHRSGVASVVTSDRPVVVERSEYVGSPRRRV